MTVDEVLAEVKSLAERTAADPNGDGRDILLDINPGAYRMWKANSGNAKRRRRWRRRDLPNTQRKGAA